MAHVAARSSGGPVDPDLRVTLNFRRRTAGGSPRFGSSHLRLRTAAAPKRGSASDSGGPSRFTSAGTRRFTRSGAFAADRVTDQEGHRDGQATQDELAQPGPEHGATGQAADRPAPA
jgi:hypothetical protein